MPFHRIPRKDAETLVPQIEALGERVVFVFAYGDQFDIFTEPLGTVVDSPTGAVFRKVDQIVGMETMPTFTTPL